MAQEVLQRRACDNVYLHKDFHGALSCGIAYIEQRYGPDAVRAYLRQFARAFYAPLTAALRERGLIALEEHFARIYALEGGSVRFARRADELLMDVEVCPAVAHMRAHGYPVARMWRETTATVNDAICEGTPFAAELVSYDEETGRRRVRFYRRGP